MVATTRTRILDVAAAQFLETGYSATSMRDIAAECGVQPASIYHHFSSKESLLTEILDIGIARITEAVQPVLVNDTQTFSDRFERAVEAHLVALLELGAYTACHVVVFASSPESVRSASLPHRDRYEAMWTTLLREGQNTGVVRPDVDIAMTRLALLGALNATLEWFSGGTEALHHVARQFSNVFLNGLTEQEK